MAVSKIETYCKNPKSLDPATFRTVFQPKGLFWNIECPISLSCDCLKETSPEPFLRPKLDRISSLLTAITPHLSPDQSVGDVKGVGDVEAFNYNFSSSMDCPDPLLIEEEGEEPVCIGSYINNFMPSISNFQVSFKMLELLPGMHCQFESKVNISFNKCWLLRRWDLFCY